MAFYDRATPEVVWSQTGQGEEILPVNIFETEDDKYVVVAPMPGMEPGNIEVTIAGKTVTVKATQRGPGQERRDYLHHEWTYGPYARQLDMPVELDAERANASFNNGVFTLTLPKLTTGHRVAIGRVDLEKTGTTEGHHRGHTGHGEAP